MPRCASAVIAVLVASGIAVALPAQSGDRANERQAPPPSHLVIPPSPVLLAEDALKTLKVPDSYAVEIAAADPLVGDPVAATFGPDGRLWVVEMRGFMPNADGTGEDAKVGAIAVLADTDHDGRMDRRTVFLDGLVLPRALALVDDGVLVAEPPHLWFCRDTNGDGEADEKNAIATDYGSTGNPEHTANGLLRSIDNWIYSANHNIRFRYLGGGRFQREFTIMRGQWGISQDDSGRLFYNTNSDPLRYDAVPAHYFARNPAVADPFGLNLGAVPSNLRVWPLRVTPGINRGYQSLDPTGRMKAVTAACAPFIYRDALLPEASANAFVCEPAGNLVKRIALSASSDPRSPVLITGRNVYEGSEFLASSDERFRPVNLTSGPDGALYVVDMYRGIIQHRIYLTTFLRRQIEERGLAEGLGMGRIYRIVPAAGVARPGPFDLTKETASQLVERLKSPTSWWRETAQRLLVERGDPASLAPLRSLAIDPEANRTTRLHALWTLEGIDGLDRPTLLAVLDAADPEVKALAIRLSESFLRAGDVEILSRINATAPATPTAEHPYTVDLQRALSLGAATDSSALTVLLQLAGRYPNDPLMASSLVSSLAGRETAFLDAAARTFSASNPVLTLVAYSGWRASDARHVEALDALLASRATPEWLIRCLLDGLRRAIPRQSDGKSLAARLAARPVNVEQLASGPDARWKDEATEILNHLRWPGHPGETVEDVKPLTAPEQDLFEKGREIYSGICAGCHQPNGQGLQGLAPALVNSRWVAGDERALARIVLHGKIREGSIMPPLEALGDPALAAALTFIRRSWGHAFAPVQPDVLAQARRETVGRAEPWTEKDLAKFLDESRIKEGSN